MTACAEADELAGVPNDFVNASARMLRAEFPVHTNKHVVRGERSPRDRYVGLADGAMRSAVPRLEGVHGDRPVAIHASDRAAPSCRTFGRSFIAM
jgi:hypothetical protein